MSNDVMVVFGINSVLEKLRASSNEILEILIADGSGRAALRQIAAEAKRYGLRVVWADAQLLDRLVSGQRHQGVVARVKAFAYLPFDELLQEIARTTAPNWVLILDGLTDPRNFGALMRSAEAVGINHVIIPKNRSAEVTPVVIKASAGAAHYLRISKVTNVRRTIGELKDHGYWTVGLDSRSRDSIYDTAYPGRLAIVLGGEGRGVRPINLRECDIVVSIPMVGKIASLNVAVAGAVFLYELLRQQRRTKKTDDDP